MFNSKVKKTLKGLYLTMFYIVIPSMWFLVTVMIFVHPIGFIHFTSGVQYKLVTNWEIENSELVQETVDFCGMFKDEHLVKCVVTRVGKKYDYNYSRLFEPGAKVNIIKSDLIPEQGYICRDIAVTYDAIFYKLGGTSDYVFSPNHVYNHITIGDLFCEINMEKYHCW